MPHWGSVPSRYVDTTNAHAPVGYELVASVIEIYLSANFVRLENFWLCSKKNILGCKGTIFPLITQIIGSFLTYGAFNPIYYTFLFLYDPLAMPSSEIGHYFVWFITDLQKYCFYFFLQRFFAEKYFLTITRTTQTL
jgi:hypothetical protein